MNKDQLIPADIRSLTSMRFFAALAVVLFHFKEKMGYDISPYTKIIDKGYLAVDFFFMLSGFIISHVYLRSVMEGGFSFSEFLKKRFSRLYPMHLVMLILFVILGVLFAAMGIKPNIPGKYDFNAIPANLLMIHAWGFTKSNTFNEPSWSISAEWFAYLLFFPLAWTMLKARRFPVALYASATALLVFFYFGLPALGIINKKITGLASDLGILRIFPEFILGMATYILCQRYALSERLAKRLLALSVAVLIILAHIGVHDLIYMMLFGALLFLFTATARYSQDGMLDKKLFVFLGSISYSMYMTHGLLYTVYFNGMDRIIKGGTSPHVAFFIWLIAISLVTPMAFIFYHFVEEPGRKFLNSRLLHRPAFAGSQ